MADWNNKEEVLIDKITADVGSSFIQWFCRSNY